MIEVVLYAKPGCHLCEQAHAEVLRARTLRSFELREVDISLDPGLHRLYGERIPVVEVAGRVGFEYHVDADALCDLLDTVSS
ncbi:MAG: hypothetical protein NVSMB25_01350 [Thermoleophilaceae bacterium]